jgi:hypothetical protein
MPTPHIGKIGIVMRRTPLAYIASLAVKATIIFAALTIAGVISARARDEFPRYGIGDYCGRIFADSELRGVCNRLERKAYGDLVNNWGTYESAKGLAYCDKIASPRGGSYELLQTCLREEIRAERRNLK